MNEKQQQLTFDKGITNVPSDAICSDNSLQEEEGLIYRNSQHGVVQRPQFINWDRYNLIITEDMELLYIHKNAGIENYIYKTNNWIVSIRNGQERISAWSIAPTSGRDFYDFANLGPTLIMATSEGLLYFRLKTDGSYESILSDIGYPEMLLIHADRTPYIRTVYSYASKDGILDGSNNPIDFNTYKDAIWGLYLQNLQKVANAGGFCQPFFLRMAIKMTSGSYVHTSSPQYCCPFIGGNTKCYIKNGYIFLVTFYSLLNLEGGQFVGTEEESIIDAGIFISKPISLYTDNNVQSPRRGSVHFQAFSNGELITIDEVGDDYLYIDDFHFFLTDNDEYIMLMGGNAITSSSIRDAAARVYSVARINPKLSYINYDSTSFDMSGNLETKEMLSPIYHSDVEYIPEQIFVYNQRLHLISPSYHAFAGYSLFSAVGRSYFPGGSVFEVIVEVIIDNNSFFARKTINAEADFLAMGWFFYPDNRAKKFYVLKNGQCIFTGMLTEHPSMEGAYWYEETFGRYSFGDSHSYTYPTGNALIETRGCIVASEVNNPRVFPAEGYIYLNVKDIIGVIAQTFPVSQGQFGEYPLVIFTSDGIFAASLDYTGNYTKISVLSREVCANKDCIIPTGDSIIFLSQKGVLQLRGQNTELLSPQIDGELKTHLLLSNGCAHDTRDNTLWFMSDTRAFVFSLVDLSFSTFSVENMFDLNSTVTGEVLEFEEILSTTPTNVRNYMFTQEELTENHLYVESSGIVFWRDFLQRVNLRKEEGAEEGEITEGIYFIVYFDGFEQFNHNNPSISSFTANEKQIYYNRQDHQQYTYVHALGYYRLIRLVFTKTCSAFPDFYISVDNFVASFLKRPSIDEDTSVYRAHLVSRPLKLENGTALKSILQTRHILDLSEGASFQFIIEASNNMKDWCQLASLHGKPWKYYRFRYQFGNLKASDTFAGSIVVTQERRTNKLR